ncbi:hypothetical protein CPB86DRAFT_874828 [Serendipita vermifera]|nr:hypothetical protein CPB86DRAFT_874828 [Serendipita vermifera]
MQMHRDFFSKKGSILLSKNIFSGQWPDEVEDVSGALGTMPSSDGPPTPYTIPDKSSSFTLSPKHDSSHVSTSWSPQSLIRDLEGHIKAAKIPENNSSGIDPKLLRLNNNHIIDMNGGLGPEPNIYETFDESSLNDRGLYANNPLLTEQKPPIHVNPRESIIHDPNGGQKCRPTETAEDAAQQPSGVDRILSSLERQYLAGAHPNDVPSAQPSSTQNAYAQNNPFDLEAEFEDAYARLAYGHAEPLAVAYLLQRSVSTEIMEICILPPNQTHTITKEGFWQCNVCAKLVGFEWVYSGTPCGAVLKTGDSYRRHLKEQHLGQARGKKQLAESRRQALMSDASRNRNTETISDSLPVPMSLPSQVFGGGWNGTLSHSN